MTLYKMDFQRGSDGYYTCNEKDSYFCTDSHECPLCIDGCHYNDVRRMWRDLLLERRPDRSFMQIIDMMSDEQFLNLLDWRYGRESNPHHSFYFDETYERIATELPTQYDTVIDFGCATAMQSMLFQNVKYIGVDDFYDYADICGFISPTCEYYKTRAQDFIAEHADEFDQDTTLALCLNVPDADARDTVATFKNNVIIYNVVRV